RRHRFAALLLGVPTLVGIWTGYVLPDLTRIPVAVAFHVLGSLFLGLTIVVILREVFRTPDVSADTIAGALCGYLLVAMDLGDLYCVVALTGAGAFRGTAELAATLLDGNELHHVLTYFSFMTLTTVGYGDILPASASARGLAIVEAVVGQFYLAV